MKSFSLLVLALLMTQGIKSQTLRFGDDISEGSLTETKNVEMLYNSKAKFNTKFKARVEEVCQARGCWMKLDLGGTKEIMVKFKDYGFFVPKDIAGKEVIVSGEAFKEITSIDDLKHYAADREDSKEIREGITEAEEVLSFTAVGVVILP